MDLKNSIYHFKLAGDADFGNKGWLSNEDIDNSQIDNEYFSDTVTRHVGNLFWRVTGGPVSSFIIVAPYNIPIRIPLKNLPPNDIMVTVSSATSHDFVREDMSTWTLSAKNHGTIIDNGIQNLLIEQFKLYDFVGRD
jgi:hypothetical protein